MAHDDQRHEEGREETEGEGEEFREPRRGRRDAPRDFGDDEEDIDEADDVPDHESPLRLPGGDGQQHHRAEGGDDVADPCLPREVGVEPSLAHEPEEVDPDEADQVEAEYGAEIEPADPGGDTGDEEEAEEREEDPECHEERGREGGLVEEPIADRDDGGDEPEDEDDRGGAGRGGHRGSGRGRR